MLKMCPDCTLKSRKMYRIAYFVFHCHQDNFWCDLRWWPIFYMVLWIDPRSADLVASFSTTLSDICIKPGAWFPTSACRELPAAVGEWHSPPETLAKARASAINVSGIYSDCSYKVSPQLDGNSWHLPPCQGKKTVLQNVLICKRKKKKKSQGGFDFFAMFQLC